MVGTPAGPERSRGALRGVLWNAAYHPTSPLSPVAAPPPPDDPAWNPLDQAWRPDGRESRFQPGWARARWNETGLRFDIVFAARAPRNGARQLNERTWELGDIAEIFLQEEGNPEYIELHVTPENQRLQLRWTEESFAAFRRERLPIDRFSVKDPHWVESASRVGESFWTVGVFLPTAALPLRAPRLSPVTALRGAVCRYDCTAGAETVHSSTAPLREPSFHRREEWERLGLSEAALSTPATP